MKLLKKAPLLVRVPLGNRRYIVCWQDIVGNCRHYIIGLSTEVSVDSTLPIGEYIDAVLSELTDRIYP